MPLLHASQLYLGDVTTGYPGIKAYTVPAGYRLILRSVTCRNRNGAANIAYVTINSTHNIASQALAAAGAVDGWKELILWVVLNPADELWLGSQLTSLGIAFTASGTLYYV